jgi:hypothetical protein
MSLHPTGIDLFWPILATQGDHSRQHWSIYLYAMDIDLPCTISATRSDLIKQLVRMSVHYMGIDSP